MRQGSTPPRGSAKLAIQTIQEGRAWCWSNSKRRVVSPISVFSPSEAKQTLSRLREFIPSARSGGRFSHQVTPFDSANHPLVKCLVPLLRDERFLEPLRPLLGETILLRSINIFSKPSTHSRGLNPTGKRNRGSHYPINWHWDDPRPGAESDSVITAWIALTPSTPQSGCVRYIAGSHRAQLDRADPLDRGTLQLRDTEWEKLEDMDIEDAILSPGEMAIHHSAVVHASAPNRSGKPRVGIAVRLYTPDSPQTVTGTRIGILLSGELSHQGTHQTEGLQLRDVVAMNWWDGKKQSTEKMNKANHFNRKKAHEAVAQSLEARVHQKIPEASWFLAHLVLVGMCDLEADESRAVNLLLEAAAAGHPGAAAIEGGVRGGNRSQALQELRKATIGFSTLAWCAHMGDTESVKLLIEAGAPVHLILEDGCQALHYAVEQGHSPVVRALCGAGALEHLSGPDGNTPLHQAAASGNGEMVKTLLELNHPKDRTNSNGLRPDEVATESASQFFVTDGS